MNLRGTLFGTTITAFMIVAGFVFCLAASWPGHLSYDSVIQLLEGRTALYANWHPPVMSWMLGLGDAVWPGAGLFVLFDSLLAFGALLGVLLLKPSPSRAATLVAAVLLLTPQFLIYPAIVWKDVLFAVANAGGFVALALAAQHWPRVRLRFGLLAAGFLLFVLAALSRQNGILALLVGAAALGWIAMRAGGWRRGTAYGGGALLAALAVGAVAHAALGLRLTGEIGPASQIRHLQGYDIAGAVAAEPRLALAQFHARDPALERLIRSDGARLYSPERNDTLYGSPDLIAALNDAPEGLVAAQWRALVVHAPRLYLRTRWAAFRWVFLTPVLADCHPYFLGVDGPPQTMKALGLARRWDARDAALAAYAGHFVGTPVLSHGFYALLALAGLVLLLRRRRVADIAMAGLLASALAFTASFFVISIACDYRYLYALDLAAMLALFYLALDPKSLFQRHG